MTLNEHRINDAIHECLERCYSAQVPLGCMAEYLEGLKRDPIWSATKIELIERHVRLILTLIVKQPPADRLSA
jgi:hypothetical protein